MSTLLRRLVTLLIALSIPATLLASRPLPAEASPSVMRARAAAPREAVASATEVKFTRLAARARIDGMNNPGTVINYAKIYPIFTTADVGSSSTAVSWRRQMTAGVREAGGRVTNITAAESAAVEQTRDFLYGGRSFCKKSTARRASADAIRALEVSCTNRTGQSKYVKLSGKYEYDLYLDSCETTALITRLQYCGGIIALIAGLVAIHTANPTVGAIGLVFGALCGLIFPGEISIARDNSSVHAIIFRKYRTVKYVRGAPYSVRQILSQ